MKKTIGIYSGTFDPIHTGHVAFAQEALRVCQLDQIVFMPEPKPRNKKVVTDIDHRVALIKAAIADDHNLSVLEPTSDQFSVDTTLSALHATFPSDTLTLLIGSDVLKGSFREWKDLETLLGDVSLAIGLRDSDTTDGIIAIIAELEATHKLVINYQIIQATDGHVASSKLRSKSSNTPHLHSRVSEYIREHDLYI